MNTLSEISQLAALPGPVHLAIGVFDGVHLGHQKVIRRALDGAARQGGSAVVVTFDPHPVRVLRPGAAPLLLTSPAHQRLLFSRLGVETALVIPFDDRFASTEPEDFVAGLAEACDPLARVCVGYDWRFGRGRRGDVHLLSDLGRRFGFEFTAIPAFEAAGEIVSSTSIREAIGGGDLGRAAGLLGRPYSVLGTVVHGNRAGHSIGFPTANVDVENELLPPGGVYAVRADVGGSCRGGVANLGFRPTIASQRVAEPVLEAHIFDVDAGTDLYGENLEVHFVERLRDERQFDGAASLREQIAADVAAAKAALGAGGP